MTEQALSVVGRGLILWLTDHGPATVDFIAQHFIEHLGAFLGAPSIVADELRLLESLGHVRRIPYDPTDQHQTLWAVVAQPATTIHIQRPTENPL